MPIYEYDCDECKTSFEIIVSSSQVNNTVTCRKCGSSNVKKTISAGSFKLSTGTSIPASGEAGCQGSSRFT